MILAVEVVSTCLSPLLLRSPCGLTDGPHSYNASPRARAGRRAERPGAATPPGPHEPTKSETAPLDAFRPRPHHEKAAGTPGFARPQSPEESALARCR